MLLRRWIAWGALCAVVIGLIGGGGCLTAEGETIGRSADALTDVATCTGSDDGLVLTLHVVVSDAAGPGGQINAVVDRSVDITTPGFNAFHEAGILSIGSGSEIFSYTATSLSAQQTRITLHWGPHVSGATEATFDVANGTMSGAVDGRAFAPFPVNGDPAAASFLDGNPSPQLHANGQVLKAIERVQAKVADAIAHCDITTAPPLQGVFQVMANRTQDFGHFTDTYGADSCRNCKLLVDAAAVAAGVTCGLVCAATFGLGCGGCIAGAIAATTAGMLGCETSGACCPVSCGAGVSSRCCAGDEACLSGLTGLCCSPGTQTCVGQECCAADQSCIDTGPNKGTCCPDNFVCGQSCCQDGEVCQNAGTGQCCLAGKVCGNACCGTAGPPQIAELFCASAAQSLCCFAGEVACNGACCGVNQECKNGACVFKQTIDCGTRAPCVDANGQPDVTLCPDIIGEMETCVNGCCGFVPK